MADQTLLLPVQWFGASAHHLAFPGTLTSHLDTHVKLMIETAEGLLRHGFKRFFILNGHSGNVDTLHLACRQLKIDWPDGTFAGSSYWDLAKREIAACLSGPRKEIGHSCEVETALLLHLHPETVRRDLIIDEPWNPPAALNGAAWAFNFEEVTKGGQIGHAASATAETGKRLLDAIVAKTVETLTAVQRGELSCR